MKILLFKCVYVKIKNSEDEDIKSGRRKRKTKANSGLKKNRTKGERYHEK